MRWGKRWTSMAEWRCQLLMTLDLSTTLVAHNNRICRKIEENKNLFKKDEYVIDNIDEVQV